MKLPLLAFFSFDANDFAFVVAVNMSITIFSQINRIAVYDQLDVYPGIDYETSSFCSPVNSCFPSPR